MSDTKRYYITTSIPYVNSSPHIGHALEFVQTDVFARYHRLRGDDTRFLTGTDENSLKNVQAAEREGIPTRDLVDRYAAAFQDLGKKLEISNDDFIRTAVEARHIEGARRLWEACDRNGDIYRRTYKGLYCVGCETFYTPDELVDGLCPEHGTPPDVVEEENYFFRLSRYGEKLAELIDTGALRVLPESRRNEVRAFIGRGLEDFSVSRSRERARGWGIEVPGDPGQVMYVWFDALSNYITALGYGEDAEHFRHYWTGGDDRVHVIGKGILRFHAVYWPGMLLSAGVDLPTAVFVHGYLTIGGGKISKSLGNAIDPIYLVDRYGVEAVRYWLLRGVSPFGDADYTDERLERLYTSDLAHGLGNLLNRTVAMIGRYRQGVVPAAGEGGEADEALRQAAGALPGRLHEAIDPGYDPQAALGAIWDLVDAANRYVEVSAPWGLSKAERGGEAAAGRRLDTVLGSLAEALRIIAEALRPFLPGTSDRIAAQIGAGLAASDWPGALRWGDRLAGVTVRPAGPIFPPLVESAAASAPVSR